MSNERRYFGTDGVRGKVGQYPITPGHHINRTQSAYCRSLCPDSSATHFRTASSSKSRL